MLIRQSDNFTREAAPEPKASHTFAVLPLHPEIAGNLAKLGYTHATDIQLGSFEKITAGRNIIGIANTGTGKTAAFLLPVLQRFLENKSHAPALVIVPTRELAIQVEEEFEKFSFGMPYTSNYYIGGTSVENDKKKLRRKDHVIIGTPGRLLDLKNQGALRLASFETLVLDEFDKMLDMGFIRDIRMLVGAMSGRKQTLLFSATTNSKLDKIIEEMTGTAEEVRIDSGVSSSEMVDQDIIRVGAEEDKFNRLLELLGRPEMEKVILFAEKKHLADRLAKKLIKSGIQADAIHGNKSQNYRIKALDKFREGKIRILVATDVAARGIDVQDVSHVVNYEMPKDYETYIHRVGRTGRAGKSGKAFTFVDEKEQN